MRSVGVLALASVAPEVRPITCPASVDIMKVDNVDFVDFATCTKRVKNIGKQTYVCLPTGVS